MYQQRPIQRFLTAYQRSTKKISISIPAFIVNVNKAVALKKFGLDEMLSAMNDDNAEKPVITHNLHVLTIQCDDEEPKEQLDSPVERSPSYKNTKETLPLLSNELANIIKKRISNKSTVDCQNTMSMFTPEMKKRILSPRNMKICLSPRVGEKKNTKPKVTCLIVANVKLAKKGNRSTSEETEYSQCISKPSKLSTTKCKGEGTKSPAKITKNVVNRTVSDGQYVFMSNTK